MSQVAIVKDLLKYVSWSIFLCLLTAYMQAFVHHGSSRRAIAREERHPGNTSSDPRRTSGRFEAYRDTSSVHLPRFCDHLTRCEISCSSYSLIIDLTNPDAAAKSLRQQYVLFSCKIHPHGPDWCHGRMGGFRLLQECTTSWHGEREEHGYFLIPLFKCSTNPRATTVHRWNNTDLGMHLNRTTGTYEYAGSHLRESVQIFIAGFFCDYE